MRDYTKGHPTIESNNHPIRHGSVVGVHNGIIFNDEELFAEHGWTRAHPDMTVDSEAIFALVEETDEVLALEQLHGSMATAWIDERTRTASWSPAASAVRSGSGAAVARPSSLRPADSRAGRALPRGCASRSARCPRARCVTLGTDGDVDWASFDPAGYVEETPLPAVRAPEERESACACLPGLVAAAL